MSAAAASRIAFRRPPFRIVRRTVLRQASTTSQTTEAASNTAAKAKDTASNATSKASEGLSRVTSSAGSSLSRVGQGVSNTLGRIGGRTGRLIATVQCEYTSQLVSGSQFQRLLRGWNWCLAPMSVKKPPRVSTELQSIPLKHEFHSVTFVSLNRLTPVLLAMIPPTIYYSRVGLELSRLVFQGQKMAPPYVSNLSRTVPSNFVYLFCVTRN